MGTTLRSEVAVSNRYWIEKHRYFELKHFCMQYPFWKRAYEGIDSLARRTSDLAAICHMGISDPVGKCIESRSYYFERMGLVERTAKEADAELADYILKGVTIGVGYEYLKTNMNIPCCKDVYYEAYRKFFWLLDKARL